jgi:GTPase SAR1 family protein
MGICGSSENLTPEEKAQRKAEKEKSKKLEGKNAEANRADSQINKLLLLGAGGCGKSTLFKQMIAIYGDGFPEPVRKTFTPIIYNNVITSIQTLCYQSVEWGPVAPDLEATKTVIDDLKGDEEIDEKLAKQIKDLWADAGIQKTYEERCNFQLNDSSEYYFLKMDEIGAEGYIPTEQDVLRSRVRTTGIVENPFTIDGNSFKMFDVGGQRNERKKWIHCFENVTAVLFVAAISEYDQVLYEDETTNCMVEALTLFDEICNSRWFRETSMILFLNKRDLFEEKLKKKKLKDWMPEYEGEPTYDAGCEFMQEIFEGKNRNQDKQIYTHICCATDTSNVTAVFNAVKDIIIRKSLNEAGLV